MEILKNGWTVVWFTSPVVSLEQDMKVKGRLGWEAIEYTSAEWSTRKKERNQEETKSRIGKMKRKWTSDRERITLGNNIQKGRERREKRREKGERMEERMNGPTIFLDEVINFLIAIPPNVPVITWRHSPEAMFHKRMLLSQLPLRMRLCISWDQASALIKLECPRSSFVGVTTSSDTCSFSMLARLIFQISTEWSSEPLAIVPRAASIKITVAYIFIFKSSPGYWIQISANLL